MIWSVFLAFASDQAQCRVDSGYLNDKRELVVVCPNIKCNTIQTLPPPEENETP